jgi:hypothetical protein
MTSALLLGGSGATGATGTTGATGAAGAGIAVGGTTGQYSRKASGTDYDTTWDTLSDADMPIGGVSILGSFRFGATKIGTDAFHVAPGTTIAAVALFYTVPAGYVAVTQINGSTAATGSTAHLFVMADAVTTPTAADRFWMLTGAANSIVAGAGAMVLDEGQSMWAFATVAADFTVLPSFQLVKKPVLGTFFTARGLAATTDVLVHTCDTGVWAQTINGLFHNTTGANIIVQTKVWRASDSATFVVARTTAPLNGQIVIPSVSLSAGDKLYVNAAAVGVNAHIFLLERALP